MLQRNFCLEGPHSRCWPCPVSALAVLTGSNILPQPLYDWLFQSVLHSCPLQCVCLMLCLRAENLSMTLHLPPWAPFLTHSRYSTNARYTKWMMGDSITSKSQSTTPAGINGEESLWLAKDFQSSTSGSLEGCTHFLAPWHWGTETDMWPVLANKLWTEERYVTSGLNIQLQGQDPQSVVTSTLEMTAVSSAWAPVTARDRVLWGTCHVTSLLLEAPELSSANLSYPEGLPWIYF